MPHKPGIFIIAEGGVNHNGDLSMAHRLIDEAASAGADAIKFQTFHSEKVASSATPRATYQERGVGAGNQLSMIKNLELRDEWHAELADHARNANIEFMSTPFHREAVDLLTPLVNRFKIGSGDLTDVNLLDYVASKGKPMIVSTGMSNYGEIEMAVEVIKRRGTHLTLMHCSSLYPTPFSHVNLRAMDTLRSAFGLPVGYSDHTLGIAIALAAAGRGAAVIEKHFTLDKKLSGPDHALSLEPQDLKLLVESIRQVEHSLGDGIKRIFPEEQEIRLVARKSLIAKTNLAAGTTLTKSMIEVKRPGDGISPQDIHKILGRKILQSVHADEPLKWEMF